MEENGSFIPRCSLRLKMERFYNEDENEEDKDSFFDPESEEQDDDDDDDDDDEEEEVVGYIDQQGIIDVMNMDLAQTKLDQNILNKAIEISKSNWLWYFKGVEQKIKEIEKTFYKLNTIMSNYEENEDTNSENEGN